MRYCRLNQLYGRDQGCTYSMVRCTTTLTHPSPSGLRMLDTITTHPRRRQFCSSHILTSGASFGFNKRRWGKPEYCCSRLLAQRTLSWDGIVVGFIKAHIAHLSRIYFIFPALSFYQPKGDQNGGQTLFALARFPSSADLLSGLDSFCLGSALREGCKTFCNRLSHQRK